MRRHLNSPVTQFVIAFSILGLLSALYWFNRDEPVKEPAAATSSGSAVAVMPLGDSITGGPGCWRAELWRLLTDAGHDVDFVGSRAGYCGANDHDPDHEGHPGDLAVDIAAASSGLDARLAEHAPEFVLMHLGTNDAWSDVGTADILDAYTRIVGEIRAVNPTATVLVAQILPLEPAGCERCPANAIALNEAIPAWAEEQSTPESPVVVVDQHSGFDAAVDTDDGVHPNDAGDAKIAAVWFAALGPLL
jgi:lysophospholipase L1-like esterase